MRHIDSSLQKGTLADSRQTVNGAIQSGPFSVAVRNLVFWVITFGIVGCAAPLQLTVQQLQMPTPEVTLAQSFKEKRYKSILIVPPEEQEVGGTKKLIGSQTYNFFLSQIERMLIQAGFRVISQDIVARIENRLQIKKTDTSTGSTYTRSEKAMVMGKETNADALLVINTLDLKETTASYIENEVRNGMREATDIEVPQATAQGRCSIVLLFKRFHFESKLIDVHSGDVLWIGGGTMDTPHLIPQNWTASLKRINRSCIIGAQNFDLTSYLADQNALSKQIINLMKVVFKSFGQGQLRADKPEPPKANSPQPNPTGNNAIAKGTVTKSASATDADSKGPAESSPGPTPSPSEPSSPAP